MYHACQYAYGGSDIHPIILIHQVSGHGDVPYGRVPHDRASQWRVCQRRVCYERAFHLIYISLGLLWWDGSHSYHRVLVWSETFK